MRQILISTLMALVMSGTAIAGDEQVIKIAIDNLGYNIVAESESPLLEWERDDFGMVTRREYAIRRNRRIPGKPAGYYRFNVRVEEYATPEEAEYRMDQILATPPRRNSISLAPEFAWREGFRIDKTVYVVSTDVFQLVEEGALTGVTSKLEEWVVDAIGFVEGSPDS